MFMSMVGSISSFAAPFIAEKTNELKVALNTALRSNGSRSNTFAENGKVTYCTCLTASAGKNWKGNQLAFVDAFSWFPSLYVAGGYSHPPKSNIRYPPETLIHWFSTGSVQFGSPKLVEVTVRLAIPFHPHFSWLNWLNPLLLKLTTFQSPNILSSQLRLETLWLHPLPDGQVYQAHHQAVGSSLVTSFPYPHRFLQA